MFHILALLVRSHIRTFTPTLTSWENPQLIHSKINIKQLDLMDHTEYQSNIGYLRRLLTWPTVGSVIADINELNQRSILSNGKFHPVLTYCFNFSCPI